MPAKDPVFQTAIPTTSIPSSPQAWHYRQWYDDSEEARRVVDPATLAATAATILARALRSKEHRPGGQRLYELVARKLTADPYASATLKGFEERPDSERRRMVLEQTLAESAEGDPGFGAALYKVLQESEASGHDVVWAHDSGIVAGNIYQRGVNIAGRDIVVGSDN